MRVLLCQLFDRDTVVMLILVHVCHLETCASWFSCTYAPQVKDPHIPRTVRVEHNGACRTLFCVLEDGKMFQFGRDGWSWCGIDKDAKRVFRNIA